MWAPKKILTALTIAVLFLVALGSAVDSWRTRKALREVQALQQAALEDAAKAKEKEFREAEEAWLRVINPVTQERDALRKKLARVQGRKFDPPKDAAEAVKRWKALGYVVEVGQ
jgi:hypothetical protein